METALTIKAAGIEFNAQQLGEQPRAIFLHGFGDDLRTWNLLWSALAGQLPALRYDQRGFGETFNKSVEAFGDESAVTFNHADDLLAILDARGIEQCDLIGVSMGGAIALNFALDHPQRVRNLILISPALVAWEWSPAWKALWRAITTEARAGAIDKARHLWWQHPVFETTRASAAGAELHESIMRFSGAQWVHDNHRLMLPDVERLHVLKTRTLLLTGARDVEDFRLIADLIAASATTIARIDWPEHGHLLQLEDPIGCAREILSFLRIAQTY